MKKLPLPPQKKKFRDIYRSVLFSRLRDIGFTACAKHAYIRFETLSRQANGRSDSFPDVFQIQLMAEEEHLSASWLAFGCGPKYEIQWEAVQCISDAYAKASDDTRIAVLNVLGISPERVPPGSIIHIHNSPRPSYMLKAQEDGSLYKRKLDQKRMHRLCDLVRRFIDTDEVSVNGQDADDLNYLLEWLHALVSDPRMPPDRGNRAAGPNVGDEGVRDGGSDKPDDDSGSDE